MLKIDSVQVFYGNVQALRGISLTVNNHEMVALIGGNGAGKSTTLLTISGLTRPGGEKYPIRGKGSIFCLLIKFWKRALPMSPRVERSSLS